MSHCQEECTCKIQPLFIYVPPNQDHSRVATGSKCQVTKQISAFRPGKDVIFGLLSVETAKHRRKVCLSWLNECFRHRHQLQVKRGRGTERQILKRFHQKCNRICELEKQHLNGLTTKSSRRRRRSNRLSSIFSQHLRSRKRKLIVYRNYSWHCSSKF